MSSPNSFTTCHLLCTDAKHECHKLVASNETVNNKTHTSQFFGILSQGKGDAECHISFRMRCHDYFYEHHLFSCLHSCDTFLVTNENDRENPFRDNGKQLFSDVFFHEFTHKSENAHVTKKTKSNKVVKNMQIQIKTMF